MKKQTPKLALRRESLRALTAGALRNANGGLDPDITTVKLWPTGPAPIHPVPPGFEE